MLRGLNNRTLSCYGSAARPQLALYTSSKVILQSQLHFKTSFGGQRTQLLQPFRRQLPPVRTYATYNRWNGSSRTSSGFNIVGLLRSRNTLYFAIAFGGFYLYNLNEAPFTHRRRMIWIPYWLETKIGDYSYRQIMYQYGSKLLPYSDPLYARTRKIMNRLLTVALENNENASQKAHLEKLKWTIHIINVDPREYPPNAFILPNGKIFIFSSILPVCKNDDGLATVLSHELSHQLAHHSSEQLSKQPFYIILSTLMYTITGVNWFNDLLIKGLLEMPASREMESEADHIGCELLARSCFNIQEAIAFWKRMAQAEQRLTGQVGQSGRVQEFFSTHPATERRIRDIQGWTPGLEIIKESSGCHEYQFGRFTEVSRNFFRK
ncbi:metalloendopeptidase activity protein [Scheffersomyces xylosifermentans]|uniref:metalloendopeptidase activity protein n=1 Tax=Scheffersomyces xylosifermentans TaxID=1304137 RepID=UPI00315DA79A